MSAIPAFDIDASLSSFKASLEANASSTRTELAKSSFFSMMPSDTLDEMAKVFEIRKLSAGKPILASGDSLNSFYVLIYGKTIVTYEGMTVGIILSGDCIGESIFTHGREPSTVSIVAEGDIILAELRASRLPEVSDASMTALKNSVLLATLNKLKMANHRITTLSRQLALSKR